MKERNAIGGWMGPINYKQFPTNAFFLAIEINVGD